MSSSRFSGSFHLLWGPQLFSFVAQVFPTIRHVEFRGLDSTVSPSRAARQFILFVVFN
uniref:Uncharacterized protein n=1 Tax=Anguilla anguilla TaxID=7936 RepID=A0A0E9WR15_ANGAN